MPVWAAIIIGLASGLVSSIVGTLLTIRHERGAEFRTRMLTAAEDYLRFGNESTVPLLKEIRTAAQTRPVDEPRLNELMSALDENRATSLNELLRIQLLLARTLVRSRKGPRPIRRSTTSEPHTVGRFALRPHLALT